VSNGPEAGVTALVLLLVATLWPVHEPARAKAREGPAPGCRRSCSSMLPRFPTRCAARVPGLGPHGTFAGAPGGRPARGAEATGAVRELVPREGSTRGPIRRLRRRHARRPFAARERADSPWRIWTVARSLAVRVGEAPLACATCDDDATAGPGDDADPTWWGDTLLYVSTRGEEQPLSLYDRTPATQLWVRTPDGRHAVVTHEPNGVLDPIADPGRRRLVFARWWFNPWHADPRAASRARRSPWPTA
jgi:hypothetical protein